ncbi:MAG: histone acetyltransferase [Glaciihabitans sp.]|nr:histone acetyltransferase [Glaciihabitans sp.]
MTEIRSLRETDRSDWERLFTAYGAFYETAFTPAILDGVWAWLMDDRVELRGLVATRNDAIVGFALFRSVLDTFTAGTSFYLDDLFVDPAARGTGAATALINAIGDYARSRGATVVRWQTAEDNYTAQSVYNRLANRTTWVTYEKELG